MSNLGGYQVIITLMKKLHGPKPFTIISISAIAALTLVVREVVVRIIEKIKSTTKHTDDLPLFEFTESSLELSDVKYKVGSSFKVAFDDGEMALIDISDDPNSPYIVNTKWLMTVSTYCGKT